MTVFWYTRRGTFHLRFSSFSFVHSSCFFSCSNFIDKAFCFSSFFFAVSAVFFSFDFLTTAKLSARCFRIAAKLSFIFSLSVFCFSMDAATAVFVLSLMCFRFSFRLSFTWFLTIIKLSRTSWLRDFCSFNFVCRTKAMLSLWFLRTVSTLSL